MPKPHRRQVMWAPRVSIPASLALSQPPTAHKSGVAAWRWLLWLLKACRSVAHALDHERKGSETGTGDVGYRQERAIPKPHRRQATWAPRVSIAPSLALPCQSGVRGDGS